LRLFEKTNMNCSAHVGGGVFGWVLQTTWRAAALATLVKR
jgi:hypothetical protein